jgi:hypothetical protein
MTDEKYDLPRTNSAAEAAATPFDLLAGIELILSEFPIEDGESAESKPNTLKVPGIVFATYRRVHTAFIEDGKKIEAGMMCTSGVYHWLKIIMDSREAQDLIDALHGVDMTDGLTPFQESELVKITDDYKIEVQDPHKSGTRSLCFRMLPGVDKYVGKCTAALRIERSSLVRACLMKGLSGQPGCNPANIEPLDKAYLDLVSSCGVRRDMIRDVLYGLTRPKGSKG